jgi:hypothetical protein
MLQGLLGYIPDIGVCTSTKGLGIFRTLSYCGKVHGIEIFKLHTHVGRDYEA